MTRRATLLVFQARRQNAPAREPLFQTDGFAPNSESISGRLNKTTMVILVLLAVVFLLLFFVVLALVHSILGVILFLLIAGLCAALAEYALGIRQGVVTTSVIGLIGAALGVIIQHAFRLPTLLPVFGVPVVWTILGSFIVVAILRAALGGRRNTTWI